MLRLTARQARQGALAQLGERLLCKHQVIGSIPIGSTTAQQHEKTATLFSRAASTASAAKRAMRRSFAATDGAALTDPEDEDTRSARKCGVRAETALFDIVNGFLKSMP